MADLKPSFEETLTYTQDSFNSLLFTLRNYIVEQGYEEDYANKESVKCGYEALNRFSKESTKKKVAEPSVDWIDELDNILRDMKATGNKELYPTYQKLLRLRKKLK